MFLADASCASAQNNVVSGNVAFVKDDIWLNKRLIEASVRIQWLIKGNFTNK